MIHLILGGARSGKSRFAEALCLSRFKERQRHCASTKLVYLATATPLDNEMTNRIEHHQHSRDERWHTIEEPHNLLASLKTLNNNDVVLVDCLTLWLNNWLYENKLEAFEIEKIQLLNYLEQCSLDVTLVSNEVGSGIVPMGEVNRLFVDHAGWLNQAIAAIADRVSLVVAGCPVTIKSTSDAEKGGKT